MKVPAYLREPVFTAGCYSLSTVARILEIEASISAKDGFREQAHALRLAAGAFKSIGPDTSPAKAFGWRDPQ